MDWEAQYHSNISTIQSNLQIQFNLFQNPNALFLLVCFLFAETGKPVVKCIWALKGTSMPKQSWKRRTKPTACISSFQTLLQSYRRTDVQTRGENGLETRRALSHVATQLWQGCQDHPAGRDSLLHRRCWGNDLCRQQNRWTLTSHHIQKLAWHGSNLRARTRDPLEKTQKSFQTSGLAMTSWTRHRKHGQGRENR